MDIKDIRKTVFIHSCYCYYYIEKNCTVLAGVMRTFGYKFNKKLSDETLANLKKVYKNFSVLINFLMAIELIIYLYLFVFPQYLKIMNTIYLGAIAILVTLPIIFLYSTYFIVNFIYEKYLQRNIGNFVRVKYLPNIYNIELKAYEEYKTQPTRKTFIAISILFLLFLYYLLTPFVIEEMVTLKNYKNAINLANVYSAIIPPCPAVYAQKAYANFKLKNYEQAIADYELANKYSLSNVFDLDILGVKTYFRPYDEIINEFNKIIALRENKNEKDFFKAEKANFMLKNGKTQDALNIYNELISTFKTNNDILFSPESAYYNRGKAKFIIGDNSAKQDFAVAKTMCSNCEFNLETNLVHRP